MYDMFIHCKSPLAYSNKNASVELKKKKTNYFLPKKIKNLTLNCQNTPEPNYSGKCSQFWDIFDRPTKPFNINYSLVSGKAIRQHKKNNTSVFRPQGKKSEHNKTNLPPIFCIKQKSIFEKWEVDSN